MQTHDILRFIAEEIHTSIMATVDEAGHPVTCAIDIMDYDENSLYFLTAKGKRFYDRLIAQEYLAFTAMKGEDTMSTVAVSFGGKVREIGAERLPRLFERNPYMNVIYPNEAARQALTVFQIYEGTGEWFDLSKQPIERQTFELGGAEEHLEGYRITSDCIGCGSCVVVCPQGAIEYGLPAKIDPSHCIHCGNCMEACPVGAVERLG